MGWYERTWTAKHWRGGSPSACGNGTSRLVAEPDLPQLGAYVPSAGLFCSLSDLLTLMRALLSPRSKADSIVSGETLARICSVHAPTFGEGDSGVGLGLFIESKHGVKRCSLRGAIGSMTCSLVLIPEQQAAVVLLQNRANERFRQAVTDQLLSMVLRTSAPTKSASAAGALQIEKPHSLAALRGDYLCPRLGLLRVALVAGELEIRWNDMVMSLEHEDGDRYRLFQQGSTVGLPLAFIRAADGQVRYVFFQTWPFARMQEAPPPATAELEPVPQLLGRFSNGFTSFEMRPCAGGWELAIEDSASAFPLIALSPARWASRAGVVEWRAHGDHAAIHWATQRFDAV